jgi:hypothetical protein
MNISSALEEALDILPFTVTVNTRAVKEAVINQVAQELCTTLRQRDSSFNVTGDAMKQALASALIETQRKVVSNPPAFVSISKKYQRRSGALGKTNSMSNGSVSDGTAGAGTPSRAASPEVSSSVMLGPGSSTSAGSLGLADFMDPQVLKTAKMWRFQKLSKAELGGLVEPFTKALPSSGATKGQLIKTLMDHAASELQ